MDDGSFGVDREDRLNAILLEYVEAIERGENPDRGDLLESFPEYAEELAAFFVTRDQFDRIAAPLRTVPNFGTRESEAGGGTNLPSSSSDESTLAAAGNIGRIGDFRLLREVGRGGMGVVYEAEQLSLRRRVALKVLPFAAAVDPRRLQRFRNEAQAAAQLHHSNIVPVYAVGAEAGVHFYSMQFIDGQSLSQLLSELREARRGTGSHQQEQAVVREQPFSSDLSTTIGQAAKTAALDVPAADSTQQTIRKREEYRRFAELIRQVADALEYAHEVGVIHRDIKPANLLLDAGGRLWITDFGLALIRSDAGLTVTGELLGTIRYMSPEQALGKGGLVDHRTDVYSLGVTLYELLTLTPAFDGEDRQVLLRQLADEEPRLPRDIDARIPAELETIVLKAMAKFPGDRYLSAREFADDLQRFLDDRPILARRPTLVDRAAKWVRRHRAAALSAVLVLVLASVGLGVSTAMIAREHAKTKMAYEREREANARERERAREAEDHYLRTRRAVDLFVELSDEGLLDFPPLAPLRQRLLEAAVVYYQELNDRREDIGVQRDLAESKIRLERMQQELASINEMNTILLLDQPVVRKHLGLTTDQFDRLVPTLSRLRMNQSAELHELKRNKSRQIADVATACRKEVEQILTASQYRQLQQVYLQLPGPHVFGRDIIEAIGLTAPQKEQAKEIQAAATQASLKIFATAESREQAMAEAIGIWKRANQMIVTMLTPTQQQRWDEMTGPPVQGEIHFPFPPADNTD